MDLTKMLSTKRWEFAHKLYTEVQLSLTISPFLFGYNNNILKLLSFHLEGLITGIIIQTVNNPSRQEAD